jgi:uncharacterized repeat protein (TIGR03803 family)
MKKLYTIIFLVLVGIIANAQFTKLLDFNTTNGSTPLGCSLITDGTFLYGMTSWGGTNNDGIIFKIKPDGTEYIKLLDFAGAANGRYPMGSLFYDGTFLYGMTLFGGTNNNGVIFKIKPDGTGYSKLFDFMGVNGNRPIGSLITDGGFLYGMTQTGGVNDTFNGGDGVIFKIKSDGSEYTKLFDFSDTISGRNPTGSLVYDGTYLYGMTAMGGSGGWGTIFKIKPDGTSYTKLQDITNCQQSVPRGSLYYDGTYLYGLSDFFVFSGSLFRIKPDGSGDTILLAFNGSLESGYAPYGSPISDGNFLYAVTDSGGTNYSGIIFKIMPDGTNYTKLFDFEADTSTGSCPWGDLLYDGTFLYGMTSNGGTNHKGTIFKFHPTGMGISELNLYNNISIYPNPSADYITVESLQHAVIEILNLQGQKIIQQQLKQGKTDIDISGLAKGLYILRLNDNDKIEVTKILKE